MLQFITNATRKEDIINQAKNVIAGGCRWIQLRMKEATKDEIISVAQELQPLCRQNDCILVVDDWVEICKELKLDGVHLGKNDMPPTEARMILGAEAIIGATANTFDDIKCYAHIDIDYIGLGPFRYTTTKKNLSPTIGLDGYKSIIEECRKSNIDIPIVAIGGIKPEDINDIMSTGVRGIAISGALINVPDPVGTTSLVVNRLNDIIEKKLNNL